jgi:hypothetical protein|tara:strand:- start:21566 stop:21895 length:330 start_codon:yes stop_codon:yes gene_type:complete
MQKVESYRPLPTELYIGTSSIEGNGLFTLEHLEENKELGISHIKYPTGDFHSDFIRTPLGGFVNHDPENPNCVVYECGEFLKLKTKKEIFPGDELTLNYSLYDPCKNYV